MILDVIQIVLLLACTGLLAFVCHRLTSHRAQPANLVNSEDTPEVLPEPDLNAIRDALIEYIERESRVLELDDFGGDEYIGYSCGYGHYQIWLSIWIGTDLDRIATNLMIGREHLKTFERLEKNRQKIEVLFPEDDVLCDLIKGNHRIGVEKYVDLSQRSNWQATSVWARENLEKLFWVISIHDAIQQSNANDFPYSGAELKAMRKRAGLTQIAVALALGLAAGSSAAVGDWEAERLKVPLRHQAKLIALYSTNR